MEEVQETSKLKKYCNKIGCNCLIDYKQNYCEKHKKKEDEIKKQRHKYYDTHQRNQKAKNFYNSVAWRKAREQTLIRDNYIDIYLYCKEGVIKKADTVHHIVELQEDYSCGLNANNLISVSEETHSKISKAYKNPTKKEQLQKELKSYIKRNVFDTTF